MFRGCIWGLRLCDTSCMLPWPPIGVASESFGAPPCAARLNLGTSPTFCPGSFTGFALGDGGMPRVNFGVREPLWLLPPGWGARNRGTGEDMAERVETAAG